MPAVTQVNRATYNVDGDLREIYYKVNIASSGDTLLVPMRTVLAVSTNGGSAAVTNTVPTAAAGGTTLTFTTGGAVTNLLVKVSGN